MPVYYEIAGHNIAAGVVLSVVDIFTVALKFWTRRIQRQPLKADDWFLVPATVRSPFVNLTMLLTLRLTDFGNAGRS
jgi:hypothetical protein